MRVPVYSLLTTADPYRAVVIALVLGITTLLCSCQTTSALGELGQATHSSETGQAAEDQQKPADQTPPARRSVLGVKLLSAIADTVSGIDALSAAVVKRANYSIERIGATLLVAPDAATPLVLPPPGGE